MSVRGFVVSSAGSGHTVVFAILLGYSAARLALELPFHRTIKCSGSAVSHRAGLLAFEKDNTCRKNAQPSPCAQGLLRVCLEPDGALNQVAQEALASREQSGAGPRWDEI